MNILYQRLKRIKELKNEGILLNKLIYAFSGIFQVVPKQETDNYSKSHLNKGTNYHDAFSYYEGRRVIWELEKEALRSTLEKEYFHKYLDFAGGTGRIASFIENRCNESYILDISEKMLAVARNHLQKTKVICNDFHEDIPEFKDKQFDLITAFRFFPNAEESLQTSAMQFISNKLTEGGLLVCNNHRNFWSIPYFIQRLTLMGGRSGMTNKQMLNLSKYFGLKLIETYSMGIIPQTEKNTLLISWKVTEKVERMVFHLIGKRHRLGYNVIYIFIKINKKSN